MYPFEEWYTERNKERQKGKERSLRKTKGHPLRGRGKGRGARPRGGGGGGGGTAKKKGAWRSRNEGGLGRGNGQSAKVGLIIR